MKIFKILAIIFVPLAVNFAVWKILVVPAEKNLTHVRDLQSLVKVKPQLESSLTQSHELLNHWGLVDLMSEDSGAKISQIQEIAGMRGVQIEQLNKKTSEVSPTAGVQILPVDVVAVGSARHLAEFIAEVEQKASFQVDQWSIISSQAPGSSRLEATLRILWIKPQIAVFAEPGKYEAVVKEISEAVGSFRELSKPSEGYSAGSSRDPMLSLVDTEGNLIDSSEVGEGLRIQGIITSTDANVALINGKFYKAGDSVGPYRIVEVQTSGVLTESGNQQTFFALYSDQQTPSIA